MVVEIVTLETEYILSNGKIIVRSFPGQIAQPSCRWKHFKTKLLIRVQY
jgi:hypothetical protein